MSRIAVALLILVIPLCVHSQSIAVLERNFVSDPDHEIVYRVAELPEDVKRKLYAETGPRIANYGQFYNTTDLVDSDYPSAQHRFSLVSENTAAVLYRRGGGRAHTQNLLLIARDSTGFNCVYHLPFYIENERDIRRIFLEQNTDLVSNKRAPYCTSF